MQYRRARSAVSSSGMQRQLQHRSGSARTLLLFLFMDADSAFSGDRQGVNAIHDFGVYEHALDRGVAHQVRLPLPQPAAVGNMDALQISSRQRREESAKSLCHGDK